MKLIDKIKLPIIITLLAVLAISYYIYLTHRDVDNNDKLSENTAVTALTNRDMEKNYPGTPKAVVEYYSDIITLYYKTSLTDDELTGLAQHARALFDDELLFYNEYEKYMSDLKDEIQSYKDADKYIADYEIENGYNIEYFTSNEVNYARVDVQYFVREGKSLINTYEKYTLRKDKDGNWKILYWEITDASEMEE